MATACDLSLSLSLSHPSLAGLDPENRGSVLFNDYIDWLARMFIIVERIL